MPFMRLPPPAARAWIIGLASLGNPALLHAENACSGAPFVNVTRPRNIEESAGATVGPQIFDVAQHPRGFVLMANNYGLLSYDGVNWRLMPLGPSTVALSVAVGPDGRMFAGGSRTFGEVIEDPTGQLFYQPFESQLSLSDRAFSDIWQTFVAPAGIAYFRSRERIIVLQAGEARALSPEGRFSAAGMAKGVLYAHDTEVGLVVVSSAQAEAVPGGEVFRRLPVTAIAEGSEGTLLIGTQDRGLFQFDLSSGEARPWGRSVAELGRSEILSVRRLPDGEVAVGTLRNGLLLLDQDGHLRFQMDRGHGLPDNAVLTLQASNGSLWAGTSGGVAQLLLPGAVENFGAGEGLPGLVESVVQHQGSIYAATSQGVFRLACRARAFEPLPTLGKQSFALLSAGALLAATADGIYEISGTGTRLVRAGLARGFAKSKDENRLWAATQTGAAGLERKGGAWFSDEALTMAAATGDPESPAGVEATAVGEDLDGTLWISLVTGQVLKGLPVRKEGGAVELTQVRIFGQSDGLSSSFAEVIALKDGVRIGTATAVLQPRNDKLVPDPRFTRVLGRGEGAFRIEDAGDSGYWVASAKRPVRLVKAGASDDLTIRNTALLRTPAGSRILDFLEVSEREVWIGTDDGAFRYNPAAETLGAGQISALVRRVQSNQTQLFLGGPDGSLETVLPHLAPLRIEFGSSSLDDPSRNRFRFRLDGQDSEWSPWTAETRKDYTNLGPGLYRFRVETSDVYGRIGREAGFSFGVLTPWYRKPWSIALGLASVVGLFLLVLNQRTRALRRRQRELEAIVYQKTTELREASFTDPLTGLRNRRYFTEVMEAEVSLAARPGSPVLHLFLVDLDHFKQINDTRGHAAGDAVLRETSSRLRTAMRTSDLIFRWGGEEFLIVARGVPELPRKEIANRIVRTFGQEPFDLGNGKSVAMTCSVGFATYPFYASSPNTVPLNAVIELADLSLYRAKQTGRNRAVGVTARMGQPISSEIWKDKVLENLEKSALSVEVLEGPPAQIP